MSSESSLVWFALHAAQFGHADLGFAHRIGQAAKTGAVDLTTGTPKMLATRRRSRFSKGRQSVMRMS
jgi:hypothetical protein